MSYKTLLVSLAPYLRRLTLVWEKKYSLQTPRQLLRPPDYARLREARLLQENQPEGRLLEALGGAGLFEEDESEGVGGVESGGKGLVRGKRVIEAMVWVV